MSDPKPSPVSRRRVFAAGGTVGALAAAAAALPLIRTPAAPDATAATNPEAERKAGYQETAHVLQYYQTARV